MHLADRIAMYNGECVRVNGLDELGTVSVTPLAPPNRNNDDPASQSVDVGKLQFHPLRSFDKVYPDSIILPGASHSVDEIPSGAILDLSHESFPRDLSDIPWKITTSCSIRGQPQEHSDLENIDPVICVENEVHVHLKNANDVVEFEDICFRPKSTHAIRCSSGKSVAFRRCRFSNVEVGALISPDLRKANCRARVTFESCMFERCGKFCVEAENAGQVMLLNCTFSSSDVAICVKEGASATARNCTVTEMSTWGAYVTDPKSELHLERCGFRIRQDYAILAQLGAKLTVTGCLIAHAENGIKIEGPKRCVVRVEDCDFRNRNAGMSVRYGKVDLIVNNSRFAGAKSGLIVDWDVTGNIDVANCSFDCVPADQVSTFCYNKCRVTVDGVDKQHLSLGAIKNLAKIHYAQIDPELCQQRVYKRAGVVDIYCGCCDNVEPKNGKFKVCARCRDACYCSRQCQVSLE